MNFQAVVSFIPPRVPHTNNVWLERFSISSRCSDLHAMKADALETATSTSRSLARTTGAGLASRRQRADAVLREPMRLDPHRMVEPTAVVLPRDHGGHLDELLG